MIYLHSFQSKVNLWVVRGTIEIFVLVLFAVFLWEISFLPKISLCSNSLFKQRIWTKPAKYWLTAGIDWIYWTYWINWTDLLRLVLILVQTRTNNSNIENMPFAKYLQSSMGPDIERKITTWLFPYPSHIFASLCSVSKNQSLKWNQWPFLNYFNKMNKLQK